MAVIVGVGLGERDDSLRQLGTSLPVSGAIALVLASLAGYTSIAAALRPVESMRRRAAEISSGERGQRLPVSRTDDEVSRLGETLNHMLARLEDAFARERRFVSDARHELRTPLAILKAELELALRSHLLEQAWDYEYENRSNLIDVYIRYLRAKIDRPFNLRTIETVRGTGYRLRPDGGWPGTGPASRGPIV